MPGLDHNGPMGQGAQTGKKQGNCSKDNETLEFAPRGRGMRRGLRIRMNNGQESATGFGRGQGRAKNGSKGRGCGMRRGSNS